PDAPGLAAPGAAAAGTLSFDAQGRLVGQAALPPHAIASASMAPAPTPQHARLDAALGKVQPAQEVLIDVIKALAPAGNLRPSWQHIIYHYQPQANHYSATIRDGVLRIQ